MASVDLGFSFTAPSLLGLLWESLLLDTKLPRLLDYVILFLIVQHSQALVLRALSGSRTLSMDFKVIFEPFAAPATLFKPANQIISPTITFKPTLFPTEKPSARIGVFPGRSINCAIITDNKQVAQVKRGVKEETFERTEDILPIFTSVHVLIATHLT